MPESERFELVVIGSGPAGEKGAAQAAYFGRKVALVERAPAVGGASVHTGTLPSKTLRETALYLTGFRRRELYGMSLRLDRKKSLRQLVGRLRAVTDRQTSQVSRNLKRHGIELVEGFARFEDSHTVQVLDAHGSPARRLSADFFLIATGSSPIPPRGIAMTDPDVVDSDRILDLDRVPTSMTVVGGGAIGTEYACIFAALGTRITLVEGRERLLTGVDEELSSSLHLSLEKMGTEILFGDAVESVERLPGRRTNALTLKLKSGRRLQADKALFSTGRSGNTEGLDLERVGVALTERGHVHVNEHFQTAVPNIYAAGDVVGFPALAATSMEQGRVAACHAFGIAYKTGVSPLQPYGIYSIPEISTIGPSEQELKQKGIAYEIGHARFENNPRGQIIGDADGFIKLLFDPESRRLLSAHILGEHATELIHIPMHVLSAGGTIDVFIDAVYNYPTLAESFKYAAYDGLQRLAGRARPVSSGAGAGCWRSARRTRRRTNYWNRSSAAGFSSWMKAWTTPRFFESIPMRSGRPAGASPSRAARASFPRGGNTKSCGRKGWSYQWPGPAVTAASSTRPRRPTPPISGRPASPVPRRTGFRARERPASAEGSAGAFVRRRDRNQRKIAARRGRCRADVTARRT